MATSNTTLAPAGGWDVRWYHAAYALAFGTGAALLPPADVDTLAGWAGGAFGSLLAAVLVTGLIVALLRVTDDWRSVAVADPTCPDSSAKYAVFAAIALQLFFVGIGVSAGLSLGGMALLTGGFNLLVAAAVAADVFALGNRGIDWEPIEYGYPVGSLLVGSVAGLAYWRHRGRRRAREASIGRDSPGGGSGGRGDAADRPGESDDAERIDGADDPSTRTRRVAFVALAAASVLLVAPAAAAGGTATSAGGDAHLWSSPGLSCVDGDGPHSTDRLRELVEQTKAALPSDARGVVVGERVSMRIDSSHYGVVVTDDGTVEDVTTGKLSDPTLVGRTDCETVKRIVESDSRSDAIRREMSDGNVTWEGVSPSKDVQVALGSKAVQVDRILNPPSGSPATGDAGDAADGALEGVTGTLSWPADALDTAN